MRNKNNGKGWWLGATKEEVLAAQGSPRGVNEFAYGETWDYGAEWRYKLWQWEAVYVENRVEFDINGLACAYDNTGGRLILEPPKDNPKPSFSIGSSKTEVLAIQGCPARVTKYLGETWIFYRGLQLSCPATVDFSTDGKVIGVENSLNILKFKLSH